jgi:hypothetical protein
VTEGIPWIGPGAYIACLIEGDDVAGCEVNWRPVIRMHEESAALLGLEEALESESDRLHSLLTEYQGGGDLYVRDVEFGYYVTDRWTVQRHALPAYRITLGVRGQVAVAVTQVVPAVRDRRLDAVIVAPVHARTIGRRTGKPDHLEGHGSPGKRQRRPKSGSI